MQNICEKEIEYPVEQIESDIYYIEDIKSVNEIIAKLLINQKRKSLRFRIDYSSEMIINKNYHNHNHNTMQRFNKNYTPGI